MKVVALAKMIPDVAELRFDPVKKTLIRDGVRNIMNSFDRRAVEEAVRLKEEMKATTTVLSMGPPHAEEVLREALAVGIDEAVLLCDPVFAGSDTLATSYALSLAIRRLGFDVVIGGRSSLDAETGQVIPEIAQFLKVGLVTDVLKRESIGNEKFRFQREVEGGIEELEAESPLVISVGEKINKPRTATGEQKQRANQLPVTKWTSPDLSKDTSKFGLAGSPTVVESIYDATYQRVPKIFEAGNNPQLAAEEALELVERLLAKEAITKETRPERQVGKDAWSAFLEGDEEVRTGHEVLSKLRTLGLRATALIVDSSVEPRSVFESGASQAIDLRLSSQKSSMALADCISRAVKSLGPYGLFFPSTVRGREIAGRVAAELGIGLIGDAMDLEVDEKGRLVEVKPAFGGNIMARIVSKTSPQAATVRPGVFERLPLENPANGKIETIHSKVTQDEHVRFIARHESLDPKLGDLNRAKAVLALGLGVGSKEEFDKACRTASEMGFAVAATRKVVDLGWAPLQLQVGLTGKSIAPRLCLALAISGATNHTIGTRKAGVILAINKDPAVAIFRTCDVGIVGDYQQLLPLMKDGLSRVAASLG